MEGGTEAFPELGRHCQCTDCNQLDFLPFKCDGCRKVFCLEHRLCKSHECPKSSDQKSRKVMVCQVCSTSIETTGNDKEDEKLILEKHDKSGDCDPSKKKKPKCPVRRCKEVLTFSNTNTCKLCQRKVCLNHRFPADHACSNKAVLSEMANGVSANKFLLPLAARNSKSCAGKSSAPSSSSSPRSAKAVHSIVHYFVQDYVKLSL